MFIVLSNTKCYKDPIRQSRGSIVPKSRHALMFDTWGQGKLPIIFQNIQRNITKFCCLGVYLKGYRKYVFGFCVFVITSAYFINDVIKISDLEGCQEKAFIIFVVRSWLTPQIKRSRFLFQSKKHSLINFAPSRNYSR